jgi:hypothetical protein
MNDGLRTRAAGDMRYRTAWLGLAALLAACVAQPPAPPSAKVTSAQAHEFIDASLPREVTDRAGWEADIYAGFTALSVPPTKANSCAVAAVIEQESGFRVDPVVPGLPAIAWREIDERAANAGVPSVLVHGVLQLNSSTGHSYSDRIGSARTEKELSDVFEDFIDSVPMGHTLFAEHNPIRTRGPMQVHILFAEKFAKEKTYPYPVKRSIADEVFTRRGGIYFGIAHLLDYEVPYDRYLYRFADFNAGQFASRNAAFQNAVSVATGIRLVADGSLLPPESLLGATGATEKAVRVLSPRLNLSNAAIHDALETAKTESFEKTTLYLRVFDLADQIHKQHLPRASVPHIELHGPKLTRKLTTEWYANRVNERFERCLNR